MAYINKGTQLIYRLIQMDGNKAGQVSSYIAVHIDPFTRKYRLHRKYLAHKFNCSIRTVNKGIRFFKHSKYYDVSSNYVTINYKRYISDKDKKGDKQHAND